MTVDEIALALEKLPPSLQREALHFIESLAEKAANGDEIQDGEWYRFSLSEAMRDLENEGPEYSEADLRESWT